MLRTTSYSIPFDMNQMRELIIINLVINRLLTVGGSWLMAQGSWLVAKKKGRGALGPGWGARDHFLGNEPGALSHEPFTFNNRLINKLIIIILLVLGSHQVVLSTM